MKIRLDWSDGRYSYRTEKNIDAWEKVGHTVVSIPLWRYIWMKVIGWLDRRVDRYLTKLDNKWHERQKYGR